MANPRNLFLILFFGCFSQVLLGWNYFENLKCCARRLIDKTDKWGQYYVDAICNIDCGSANPTNYQECSRWVQAKDWRDHADVEKMPQAEALLALAGLSQICLANSFDTLTISRDTHELAKRGDVVLARSNPLAVCYPNKTLTAALPIIEINTSPQGNAAQKPTEAVHPQLTRADEPAVCYPNETLTEALANNEISSGPQLNAVQKPIETVRPQPVQLYNTQDLLYVTDVPWGRNKGKVYQTNSGLKLYVKERHLKGPYDSLLISYFTHKMGQLFCPGQIVTIVPVIDGEELKIASFGVEGFVGQVTQETKNQMLLFLVLDLMNIMDRGRQNIGYTQSNNLAYAVDVDLLDFPEGIDNNLDWIHMFKDRYQFISDDFKEALKHISSIKTNMYDYLSDAESELRGVLPSRFHDIFGHPHLYLTKYKVLLRKQQMQWVLDHYEVVAKILNDTNNEIPLENLIDAKLQREDLFGFFLYMAIERNDTSMIKSLCANDIRTYGNVLVWAHHKKKNKSLLKNIQNDCLYKGHWPSLISSYEIMIGRLDNMH